MYLLCIDEVCLSIINSLYHNTFHIVLKMLQDYEFSRKIPMGYILKGLIPDIFGNLCSVFSNYSF